MLHSWMNESPTEGRVRWPDEPFSRAGVLGFCDSEGHMEPAVSVRPCLKTHESQTEVHHESTNSLNVCPAVGDEMDEENLDDKEEQSEESREVRVGQGKTTTPTWLNERNMNVHTFRIEVSADIVSLHGQAILLIVAESWQRRSKMARTRNR